jgi:NAD(P)-dependent dehydrogenase (short-subunit alcohol dehydrogenase family)
MAKYELDGRTAIVTGGGAGIGEACAHALSSSGAAVLVVDMNDERAEGVAGSISEGGGTALPHVADVSNPGDVEAMVARAEEELGPLRIAVNNAGIGGTSQPTGQYDLDAWRRVMSVNLDGVFYCMRAQIGPMSRAGGGSIVNMSSVLGSVGIENSPAYVASKHGVVGLTKAAALGTRRGGGTHKRGGPRLYLHASAGREPSCGGPGADSHAPRSRAPGNVGRGSQPRGLPRLRRRFLHHGQLPPGRCGVHGAVG